MFVTKILAMCGASVIAAGGMLLVSSQPASAEPIIVKAPPPPQDLIVRHVTYADLNLASDAGVNRLNRRVGSIVNDLCFEATSDSMRSLFASLPTGECRAAAWNQAQPQIERAAQRAREMAATGSSMIAATGIVITLRQ